MLLTLAIQALKHTDNPGKLMERLVREQEIKTFLLNQVGRYGLDRSRAARIAGGRHSLRVAEPAYEIEEVLKSQNVRRTLTFLSSRYLLKEMEGEEDTQYDH